MASEKWQIECLDSLRGFAVLGVLLVHSAYWGPAHILQTNHNLVDAIIFAGQRGVQLFFLLSAFALYLSFDNRRAEHSPIRNFFLRRFFRLTPMFYLATVLGLMFLRSNMGTPGQVLLSMLYLNDFSPAAIAAGAPVLGQ